MSKIVSYDERWDATHNGDEVEEFIKQELKSKVGFTKIPESKQEDGFYHEWGFATKEDYDLYVSDKETYADLLLYDSKIPISTDKGVSYSARLYCNETLSDQIVSIDKVHETGLRFCGILNDNGYMENAGITGTLTFQRSTDGGNNWETVGTANIASRNTDDETFDTFEIGQYFSTTNPQQIRVRVSFNVEDDEGNVTASAQSTWLTWSHIIYTQLTVENCQDWSTVIDAESGVFPLSFAVGGAVDKWLHITISGASGTYSYVERMSAETQYPKTSPKTWTEVEKNGIGILTHGIHTVTAWVTCDDGSGHLGTDGYPDSLSSDVIVNRYMVVNTATEGADLTQPYLMLQNVLSEATNYVRCVLTNFSVYIPSGIDQSLLNDGKLPVSVLLTDYGESDTTYTHEYIRQELLCENNVKYDVDVVIEIEGSTASEQATEYFSYFRVFRYASDESVINFMYESLSRRFMTVTVDNSENFAPVAGAHFVLSPNSRNNSEENWKSIINQQTGATVVSEWNGFSGLNDGWTYDSNGRKVLRVLAGESIQISGYEPFEQFKTNGTAKLTIELNYAINNVTREDTSVFEICQDVDGNQLGLRMFPLEGNIKANNRQNTNDQDFAWEEGKKTHLALVIDPAVVVKADDELTWQQTLDGRESVPLALAKVYINANPFREMDYSPLVGTWISDDGHGGIKIGCPYADIDIYGIRIYRSALSSQNVFQNYKASLPTVDEKRAVDAANAITTGGRVDYAKAKAAGYRCLTLVGQDQYKLNQDKETGYPCYWRIDHNDPNLSGTIGKAAYLASVNGTLGTALCLMITAQGSTANTYWENNGQTKVDEITYRLLIPFSKVHSDFGWIAAMSTGEKCENPMYLNGTRIEGTAYEGLSDEQKALVMIEVVDGWFDGNGWSEVTSEMGMYHGQFYTSYIGGAKCAKLVNKINYASPMQSHKMGATKLYHDVMQAVTGGNSLTKAGARFAVYEESFMYFTEHPNDNGKVEFHGMCTFGNGKYDKATFGYAKDDRTFIFEGLDNDLPLCDFRVPADEDVTYSPDKKAWSYNGVKSFEYGLGQTQKINEKKYPTDTNDAIFRRYVNFIYCHCTSLRYYNGTRDQFDTYWQNLNAALDGGSSEAGNIISDMKNYQYWCTSGDEAFKLIRFNHVNNQWVNAGTWNHSTKTYTAGERNLSKETMTKAAYDAWVSSENYGDYSVLNASFISAITEYVRSYFGGVGRVDNHLTHYNLVPNLLSGTDNCSKNAYFQYDPEDGLIWMDQDDLDSIHKTDNNGRQTKKYFLDRMHDVEDYNNGYKPQIDYMGRGSVLNNMIEDAYERYSTGLRDNMRSILTAMSGLVKNTDNYDISVYGCIEKYFFSIQEYFPQIAYCEQARLRYEWPKSFGYISYGNQARGIDPITQQVGSQLESERQYMKRRLAYIASYACWGDFSCGVNSGVIGLDDSGSALSMSPGSGKIGGNYIFELTPHQWLYPTGAVGRSAVDPHVRVAPGETYTFTIAVAGQVSGDGSASLAALNYYRKIGNIGGMVVGNNSLNVNASRLMEFIAEPGDNTNFVPGTISLVAPNLQKISMKGCTTISGTQDYTSFKRLEELDLRDTMVTRALLNESALLTSLYLPETCKILRLVGLPNLTNFEIQEVNAIETLYIDSNTPVSAWGIVQRIFENYALGDTVALKNVTLTNLNETLSGNSGLLLLMWLTDLPTKTITGKITLASDILLTYEQKMKLINAYGDIDDENNPLYIVYSYNINIMLEMKIFCNGVADAIHNIGSYQFRAIPMVGNNYQTDANYISSVEWSLEENRYATISSNGLLTVTQLGTAITSPTVELTLRCTLINGDVLTDTLTLSLYDREVALGEYVYADGSHSPNDYSHKTKVGIVFINEDGLCEVCMLNNLTGDQWGLYNHSSQGVTGVTTDGTTSAYDTPLENLASGTSPAKDTNTGYFDTTLDEFKSLSNTNATGQLKYTPTEDIVINGLVENVTLEANKTYPAGYRNTLILMRWRNTILSYAGLDIPVASVNETEYENLSTLIARIVADNNNNYRQYYYPAASWCYAYQPAVRSYETLSDKFKAHKWWLPSCGELARMIFYWLRNDETGVSKYDAFKSAKAAGTISSFGTGYLWCSTEFNPTIVWFVKGDTGVVSGGSIYVKNFSNVVRAVCAL